ASPNESIVFTGVPNPKLSKLMSLVSQRGEALVSREGQEAPSLSSLLTLADEQQRFLEFSTGTSDDGTMLVAFRTVSTTRSAFPVAEMKGPKTNEPIQNERKKSFIRQARELASRWLPSYMNPPHYRVLLDPPLTINGKIDVEHLPPIRREGRAGVMLSVPPATPAEEVLLQIWREVLGRTSVGVTENFFDAGGDSIQSIQVVARAARKGMAIQPRDMIRFPTVRELAKESVEARVNQPAPESRESAVSCSLLPIHHWFFSLGLTAPNHFNQTVLLDTPLLSGVALRLEKAVAKLTELHQALRLRFVMSDGRWNAVLGESVVAVRVHADPMTRASIEERCRTAQATLDIVNGPLGRIEYFAAPEDGRPKLLVTLHHLITDGVSFRILLMELSELLLGEERTNLPHVPTSLATWSDQVIQYAKSPVLLREIALWKRLLGSHPLRFPEETASDAVAIEGEAIVVEVALDENETTRLLESAMGTASGGVDAYFVSACVGSLLAWSKNTEILVDLDAHGREAVLGRDASRTVGWLTALVPLRVRLSESADPIACLADTLMTMQSVPHRGIGFGVLRYCADANVQREFSELPKPDVALNYLGTLDRVLAPGVERSAYFEGPWRSPSCKRIYRITADAMTLGGRLVIRWSASRNGYSQEMLEKIAEDTMNRLRTLVSPHPTKGS
ncbi:MAG: hypothetical protein KBF88_16900, partial [Polyangiaceae bacterium]|nr:hypothetical protein [Polyangiaceae bacterium]